MAETATLDIETELYTAIWTLLNNDPIWRGMVDIQNQIRYDLPMGAQNPENPRSADGDYPQAMMGPPIGGTDKLYTTDETFDTYSDDRSNFHWMEQQSLTYQMVVTSQLLGAQEIDKLGNQTRNCIRRGGPKLGGVSYVTSITLSWRTEQTNKDVPDPSDGSRRFRTTINIAVSCEQDGNTLLGD